MTDAEKILEFLEEEAEELPDGMSRSRPTRRCSATSCSTR